MMSAQPMFALRSGPVLVGRGRGWGFLRTPSTKSRSWTEEAAAHGVDRPAVPIRRLDDLRVRAVRAGGRRLEVHRPPARPVQAVDHALHELARIASFEGGVARGRDDGLAAIGAVP